MRSLSLLLVLAILNFSCTQKQSHDEAIRYVKSLLKAISIDEKENAMINMLGRVKSMAKEDLPPDQYKLAVDSLQALYKEVLVIYDDKLRATDSIKEMDNDDDLKTIVTDVIEKRKKLHSLSSILVYQLAPNRFKETAQQSDSLKKFAFFAQHFKEDNPAAIMRERFTHFMHKYNITDAEMENKGL